jgi:hypothetical protein
MEFLKDIWSTAPFWATVVVLAAVALAAVRFRRWRSWSASRHAGPFPLETEADLLDSSHIGFAPLGLGKKRADQPLEAPGGTRPNGKRR